MPSFLNDLQARQNAILRDISTSPNGELSEETKKAIAKSDEALKFGRPKDYADTPEGRAEKDADVRKVEQKLGISSSDYPSTTPNYADYRQSVKKLKDAELEEIKNTSLADYIAYNPSSFEWTFDNLPQNAKRFNATLDVPKSDRSMINLDTFKVTQLEAAAEPVKPAVVEPEIDPATGRIKRKFDLE